MGEPPVVDTPRNINLHPNNHLPTDLPSHTCDVIVIGSGPVGRLAATKISAKGHSVVIVENELFGGDCPFWACIPSKAILRPGEAVDAARAVEGAKELISGQRDVDVEAVFRRRDGFLRSWDDGFIQDVTLSEKCDFVRGFGSISGTKKVCMENWKHGSSVELEARHAVILATGSSARIPDVPGLIESKPWTTRHATAADEVPAHLIILGSGVAGVEVRLCDAHTMLAEIRKMLIAFRTDGDSVCLVWRQSYSDISDQGDTCSM